MPVKVDVCFATYGTQAPQWWSMVLTGLMSDVQAFNVQIGKVYTSTSMLSDWNKNHAVAAMLKRRDTMTDTARNKLTAQTLDGPADYSFWIDDDTIPPVGALAQMLELRREFVSGLYFLPKPPYTPIAYIRSRDPENYGLYHPLADYDKGQLMPVDCVGMGCALIHRSVFEKIRAESTVYRLPNGALLPVHKSEIRDSEPFNGKSRAPYVEGGVYHAPLTVVDDLKDQNFPYFMLDSQRTEDFFFCEMAEKVGIKPWLDTSIVCEHLKMKATTEENFRAHQKGGTA